MDKPYVTWHHIAQVPDIFAYLVYRVTPLVFAGTNPNVDAAAAAVAADGVIVAWTRLSAKQLLIESGASGDAADGQGVGAPPRWMPLARDRLTESKAQQHLGLPPRAFAGELLLRVAFARVTVDGDTDAPRRAESFPAAPVATAASMIISALTRAASTSGPPVPPPSTDEENEAASLGAPPRPWRVLPPLRFARRRVVVHVLQARGLPSADPNGLIDPYVCVAVPGAPHAALTAIRSKTRNPLWDEALEIDAEARRRRRRSSRRSALSSLVAPKRRRRRSPRRNASSLIAPKERMRETNHGLKIDAEARGAHCRHSSLAAPQECVRAANRGVAYPSRRRAEEALHKKGGGDDNGLSSNPTIPGVQE